MDNFFQTYRNTSDQRDDSEWLSIVEYSRFFNISISTVRRKIKSQKLKFVVKEDMYFIEVLKTHLRDKNNNKQEEMLKLENQKLKEEINELKMLIEAYEKFD